MLITDNSPGAGSIAWSSVQITRNQITYTPANGNTDKKFIWWDFSAPTVLQTADTMPTLEENDALIFINDGGTHHTIPIQTAIHGASIKPGTINQDSFENSIVQQFEYGQAGVLASDMNLDYDIYVPEAITITEVYAAVRTAPTDASLIVDVHKNGTTIFTTQDRRPTILATEFAATSGVVEVTSCAKNDKLTVHIDQVGSSVTGSDLVVFIRYTQT